MRTFRLLMLSLFPVFLLAGCTKKQPKEPVVLYSSQDQIYAEPILKEFTRKTGIEIKPLFDSESAKTVGLAHRLRAERSYPECDVFWSNEELYSRTLARDDILSSENIRTFGYRTRRLVINTNKLALADAPHSLLELTNNYWRGKFVIAYPLFGTTGYHFLALRQRWGDELWKNWCHGILRNGVKVVDGNSVVVKLVGAGEATIGLTDWDDINAGKKQGFPITELPLNPEFIAIPNTVAIVRGAPHFPHAEMLRDFISNRETVSNLVNAGALEGADISQVQTNLWQVDRSKSLEDFQEGAEFLRLVFVRS
jgi:iron(III) transport system substrate-binding protein